MLLSILNIYQLKHSPVLMPNAQEKVKLVQFPSLLPSKSAYPTQQRAYLKACYCTVTLPVSCLFCNCPAQHNNTTADNRVSNWRLIRPKHAHLPERNRSPVSHSPLLISPWPLSPLLAVASWGSSAPVPGPASVPRLRYCTGPA